MEEPPDLRHVVGLSLCDSAPLLWRVEDLRSVRSQGLVGALLGSLPRTPRQNGRLGRPLLLLPEEERLLSERRAAAGLPAGNRVSLPTGRVHPPGEFPWFMGLFWWCWQDGAGVELLVKQHEEEQQRSYEEQSVFALEDRKSALLRAMTSPHTGEPDWSILVLL